MYDLIYDQELADHLHVPYFEVSSKSRENLEKLELWIQEKLLEYVEL
jgi:hypothetical protein